MTVTFNYQQEESVPVDVEGLTPDWAADKTLEDIRRFTAFVGNRKTPVGELFDVAGDPSAGRFEFFGDLAGVHSIGAGMQSGKVRVHSHAGRHVGSRMSGGSIEVSGNTAGWAATEMAGGCLHIRGNTGNLLAAASSGTPRGMTGGTILVEGNAGDEVGLAMRRGLIAIGGTAGDLLGREMIAGTILVFGNCGARPGAEMRRGTLALLGTERPTLLPTFRYACRRAAPVMPLLLAELRRHNFPCATDLATTQLDMYHGDMLTLGKGEVWLQCAT